MKLATWRDGTRDGRLVVVSKDLTKATYVDDVARTMQRALDRWSDTSPQLAAVYRGLNNDDEPYFSFQASSAMAPLPRAYQWADGSAYVTHVQLVRQARGAELPESFWHDPLMYQGGSDCFLGAEEAIQIAQSSWGIDYEAEVGVITNDVPMGANETQAREAIALFVLINDVSLRHLIPDELAKNFGFFHSKPASSFSPVAVTPDELGEAWDGDRLHLPLISQVNGRQIGAPNAGIDMTFSFPQLIAHAAKTRHLGAGAIIGSGTVANADESVGASCLAEVRMREQLKTGEMKTPFLSYGDRVCIDMLDAQGSSIFGAINQEITSYEP